MASITKQLDKKKPAYFYIDDLKASDVRIDGTQQSVLEHILNDTIHLTEAEKDKIRDIVENGAGIKPEDWEKILEKLDSKADKSELDNKADKNHTHDQDTNFFILASQVIESNDRKFVNQTEKEALSGITDNVQLKINEFNRKFKETMFFKGVYTTYAEMIANNNSPENGWTVFIHSDETCENSKTIYVYKNAWTRVRSDKNGAGWVASATEPSTDLLWIDISDMSNIAIKWHNGIAWRNIGGSSSVSADNVIETTDRKFVSNSQKEYLEKMQEDPVSGGLMYNGVLLGSGGAIDVINDILVGLDTTYSSMKIDNLLNNKQNKLSYTPENNANKNKPNGYAGLTSMGLISTDQLPREALYKTTLVSNESERLAKTEEIPEGDYSYEKATGRLFLRVGIPNSSDPNYNPNNFWHYVADSYKMSQSALNKLNAQYNPMEDDDETVGYGVGSIWVNIVDKKSYICTDATATKAKWDLMGGQVNLNVGEIVPFMFDENMLGRTDGQTRFPLPSFNYDESYIEVSINGVELIIDKDYVLTKDPDLNIYYLDMFRPTEITDVINGEIYQSDIDNVTEYMTKSQYDSNHDGKVDRAEIADAVAGLSKWESGKAYKIDNMILSDNKILKANKNFTSALSFNPDNWDNIYTMPLSLAEFTTAHLKDSTNKRYVNDDQLTNVNKIPSIETNISNLRATDSNLQSHINTIKSYIPSGVSSSNQLVSNSQMDSRFTNLKLKDLNDTSSVYLANGFLKVNANSNGIEYIQEPRFPIMKITDRRNNSYEDIYDLEIMHFEKESFENGKLVLEPKMKSTNLLDMPAISTHGALLVSNQTLMQYDLVPADELSISQENFTKEISVNDWMDNQGVFEYTLEHSLDSEALVISFVDKNKRKLDNISYQILDSKHVLFTSDISQDVKITINCSLGVINGYWNHIFDVSKITLINDNDSRADRTYSSIKLESMMKKFADKDLVYSKDEANNVFAYKTNEHGHSNYNLLNKITEDSFGNMMYNGKKLLTDIKGRTVEISSNIKADTETEIVNVRNIVSENHINTIIASEIIIKNDSDSEMNLKVKDGNLVLVDELIPINGVQKYSLGVSIGTAVYVEGTGSFNYYMSTL